MITLTIFDAALYAKFLRDISEKRDVRRIEGDIVSVKQNIDKGNIESIELKDGTVIEGELFIDCSGFKGILIEQTLNTGYFDWSNYLPCNRAVTRLTERQDQLDAYTRSTAKEAGWQWRIPLQSRTGNGYVYCSDYISDDEAHDSLNATLDKPAISEARVLKFITGIRKKTWHKNVVAIGLSAGFLEPLESTSIHLIQTAIARLLTNWPDLHFNEFDIEYFNRKTQAEYEKVRDFLILHYHATKRDDYAFWKDCSSMAIPESLTERINIYSENARLYREDTELFTPVSWFAVFQGQNIIPKRYHPIADTLDEATLEKRMNELHRATQRCVEVMPMHEQYLSEIIKA